MSKHFQPGYILSEPPVITIGDVSTTPEDESPLLNDPASEKRVPVAPSPETKTDDHLISMDEVVSFYEMDAGLDIEISYDANLIPPELSTMYFIPSQTKKNRSKKPKEKAKKSDIAQEVMSLLDESDIAAKKFPPAAIPTVTSTEQKPRLTERTLYRILTNKYTFGCFGSTLYVQDDGVYSEVTRETIAKLLMDTLTEEEKDYFTIKKSSSVRDWLFSSSEVRSNQLVFPKDRVLFANGCFDIVAKKAVSTKKKDFFLTRINARYLPYEDLHCPYFDAYLETSSGGDESIKKRICAMLGYLLLAGYPGKKILVLGTAKDSGKSMIMRFFQRLVGPELVSGQTPFDMTDSHASAEFSGKIVNAPMDIPAIKLKPPAVGLMKALSGGDLISLNPKGKSRRSQFCFTKQILGTNAEIKLQQFDEAFWNRITIIPYVHSIQPEHQIFNLEEKLWEERDAIVTKCMKAARKLIKNDYAFPECEAADRIKDSWIGWPAYAKSFLEQYCIVEESAYTHSTPLYEAYVRYCQEHTLPYGSQKSFICYAKKLFPSDGNPHRMIDGVQRRGLPDVRFLGEL